MTPRGINKLDPRMRTAQPGSKPGEKKELCPRRRRRGSLFFLFFSVRLPPPFSSSLVLWSFMRVSDNFNGFYVPTYRHLRISVQFLTSEDSKLRRFFFPTAGN